MSPQQWLDTYVHALGPFSRLATNKNSSFLLFLLSLAENRYAKAVLLTALAAINGRDFYSLAAALIQKDSKSLHAITLDNMVISFPTYKLRQIYIMHERRA